MCGIFESSEKLEQITFGGKFNTENVTDMSGMFYNCLRLNDLNLSSFNTSKATNMSYMFFGCVDLKKLDVNSFNTSNVINMRFMFGCLDDNEMKLQEIKFSSNFNTQNVTDMESMFYNCTNLIELDLSSFDTAKVENMSWMIACRGGKQMRLEKLILSSRFDTKNVTNMNSMFFSCTN